MQPFPGFGSTYTPSEFSSQRTLIRDLEPDRPNICANYKLTFYNCEGLGDQSFNAIVDWLPIEYVKEITEEITKEGVSIVSSYTVRKKFGFEVITDDATSNYLEESIALYPDAKLRNLDTAVDYDLFAFQTELLSDSSSPLLHKRLTFYCKQYTPVSTEVCCAGVWPGDGEIEIRDPTDLCAGKNASLGATESTLTLTVTGSTIYSSSWTRDGVPIGDNLTSANIDGLYGLYFVNVDVEGCQFTLQYNNVDPCVGFNVTLATDGSIITATTTHNDVTFAWEYSADGSSFSTIPGSTSTIVATDPGFYKVLVSNGVCDDEAVIEYLGENACDYEVIITADEDYNLSATVDPFNLSYTYQWYIDNGSGRTEIPGANSPEYAASESGFYELKVTLDDCEVYGRKVVILPVDSGLCCDITGIINMVGEDLVLSFDGCDDDAYITWFVNTGSGFIQIGTGTTVTPGVDGLYRAHIRCGDCEKDVDYLYYNCEENPCDDFNLELTNNGDEFTVVITGCDHVTSIEWSVENEDGITQLFIYGPTITPTIPGLYKAKVTCGDADCVKTIAFMAYECNGCLEVNFGEPEPVTVCN